MTLLDRLADHHPVTELGPRRASEMKLLVHPTPNDRPQVAGVLSEEEWSRLVQTVQARLTTVRFVQTFSP